MKNYSLLSLLLSGLAFTLIVFLTLFFIFLFKFESLALEFLKNQCLTIECSPEILSAIQSNDYLDPVIYSIAKEFLPWFCLFSIVILLSGYFLYREISLPLHEIKQRAQRFSRGVLNSGMPDYKIREFSKFAHTMNNLGNKLKGLELMRKDFVANVSHELKTPITSIKGFVETILDGDFDNQKETRYFLSIIKEQADRMGSIIEDLILISKLENESSAVEFDKECKSVADLLTSVSNQVKFIAIEKNISLNIVCPTDLKIDCNPVLIEQAFSNVIDNSIKYSEEGSKIEVIVSDKSGIVEVVVKDNGPGIPSNHLERIFERFYRVDPARSRQTGGTGLGLSITKHIVSAHNGKVMVESERGIGTLFTIILPKAA